jgi:hypothetical protein
MLIYTQMPTFYVWLRWKSHHIKMNAISDLTDFSYDFQDLDFKKYNNFSSTTKWTYKNKLIRPKLEFSKLFSKYYKSLRYFIWGTALLWWTK